MTGAITTPSSESTIPRGFFTGNGETRQLRQGVTLRLHLVRHAETEANYANIVLGQIDSPLTKLGVQQAKCAGMALGAHSFWKTCSSDLYRAEKTARLILGDDDDDDTSVQDCRWNKSGLILDARLRERGKGVREGRDKSLTYDEALELYHEENTFGGDMPLLETEHDVWKRVRDWIGELLSDVCRADDEDRNIEHENLATFSVRRPRRVYDVLAVSHSGTLRIIIDKIAGEGLFPEAKREPTDDGSGKMFGRLIVPNTSVTVIDVFSPKAWLDDSSVSSFRSRAEDGLKWETKLVELTRTSHLDTRNA